MFIGVDVDQYIADHPLLTHRLLASAGGLPFASGQLDLITANMVVEHLDRPEDFVLEAARLLAPGGLVLIHTPNLRYYLIVLARLCPEFVKKPIVALLEGRQEKEIFRTFYRANTVSKVRALAASAGLSVDSVSVNGSVGSFGFMGPLGVLEVLLLKLLSLQPFKAFNAVLLIGLRKT
jgi:SAM-dependent methyltransferase